MSGGGNVFNVSRADIDFSRGVLAVAFMRQNDNERTEDDAAQTRSYDQALDSNQRHAWRGTFSTIYHAVEYEAANMYRYRRHFRHCEICFYCSDAGVRKFGSDFMIACGARDGSGVQIVARRFNDAYKWLYLTVTRAEQELIVDFLFAQLNKKYDRAALFSVYTAPRVNSGRAWYCSELVLAALQLLPCATLHSHRFNCVDIDDTYSLIRRSTRRNESSLNISPQQISALWTRNSNSNALDSLFSG